MSEWSASHPSSGFDRATPSSDNSVRYPDMELLLVNCTTHFEMSGGDYTLGFQYHSKKG